MRTAALVACVACVVPARQLGRGERHAGDGISTAPVQPNLQPSDEATPGQLLLAREQGDATGRALSALLARHPSSGRAFAGEYEVAFFVEAARGAWERVAPPGGAPSADDGLAFRKSPGNFYLGVVVRDGADGRTVPAVGITATLLGQSGPLKLPWRWDPSIDQYGANVDAPAGSYRLRLELSPPSYDRHDPVNGDRFGEPVVVEFRDVELVDRSAEASDATLLALGRAQGDALLRAWSEMADSTANDGQLLRVGDYRVGCGVEFAETYWQMQGSELSFNQRPGQSGEFNAHLEVAVLDGVSGRFLPDLHVHAQMIKEDGSDAGAGEVRFMWHPWLFHYGKNWRVPGAGRYRVKVHVDAPDWPRGDETLGRRFAAPVDVECPALQVEVGQK